MHIGQRRQGGRVACRERRLALAALVIVIVTFDWNRPTVDR